MRMPGPAARSATPRSASGTRSSCSQTSILRWVRAARGHMEALP
jgi:hypothetical protein